MTPPRDPIDCPNLRGTGIDVLDIFRRLADGDRVEDLLHEYPALQPGDLRACFAYAAKVLAQAAPPPADVMTADWEQPAKEESVTLSPPAAPDAATLPPQSEFAPTAPDKRISIPGYEVLGKLGEGGMGVVYKARHLRLNRVVALKMILAGEHASEEMLARFALEAEAVAQMQHPGIVQIYEIGEHDGHSFLALEYVAGGSLASRLDDKPWPADKAAELVETLARSMQAAHERGIVHRDLKPANVLLTEDGRPMITDFGLAKRLQDSTGRTRTGEIMGTPEYMAPEQAAGKKDVGPAADVYVLGGILYRLMTGRPPFQGQTTLDTLMQALEQDPMPVRQINRSAPRDLETIALKCLAKEPGKRYDSASGIADDLQRFLDGDSIRARRLTLRQRLFRWARQRPGAALARGGLVLLLLVILTITFASPGGLVYPAALACILSSLFSLFAVSRAKPRPLLIGLSVSLFLAIVLVLEFVLRTYWLHSTQAIPRSILGLSRGNLATIVCFLPLLIGLVLSQFSRRRERILGVCLVPLLYVLAHTWSEYLPELSIVIIGLNSGFIIGLYFGTICRAVRWYCGGGIVDTVVGSVWGALVGSFLGSMTTLVLFVWLSSPGKPGDMDAARGRVSFIAPVLYIGYFLGPMVGSIVGAYLGALSGRKASRSRHV
jgi:tRNA A-37 threonylcarbamoyl transferase component Bud32